MLQAARMAGVAAVLLVALPVISLSPKAFRPSLGTRVARLLLRCFGVHIAAFPGRPGRAALLVLNHVSWLDIVILLAWGEVTLVAKTEVRQWPLIGRIAIGLGTLFVDRARPRRLPATVAEVATTLRAGRSVAVFAEGTTGCGRTVLPFRPAMFQAAVDAGTPVVPVALSIKPLGLAGFLGEESLWDSVRRVVRAPRLTVTLTAGRALYPMPYTDRRTLARIARTAVVGRLAAATRPARPTACVPAQRRVMAASSTGVASVA